VTRIRKPRRPSAPDTCTPLIPMETQNDRFAVSLFFMFLPILYAEIHYTLKGFSLIFRRWPEIVADAPYACSRSEPCLFSS